MSTLADLQALVIPARFDAGDATQWQSWLNERHGWVWAQEDWPFRHVYDQALAVTTQAVSIDVAFPGLVLRPDAIYDNNGTKLGFLDRADARRLQAEYEAGNRSKARPGAWGWLNRQVVFDNYPDAGYAFTIDYTARLYHLSATNVPTAGALVLGTDQPAWALHYDQDQWLAQGAAAALMKVLNDPTYPPLEDEFTAGFAAMAGALIPDRPPGTLQYGRDSL